MIGILALLPMALSASNAQITDPPLKAVTPWVLQVQENACSLGRGFGREQDKPLFHLVFQQMPLENELEVMLISDYKGARFQKIGKARLDLIPEGTDKAIEAQEYIGGKGNVLVRKFSLKGDQISNFKSASSLRLMIDGAEPIQIVLSGTANAFTKTDECQDGLLRKWGFDPAVMHALSNVAEPLEDEARSISYRDYPTKALLKGLDGWVRILFTVDPEGRVIDCKNIEISSPVFGPTACAIARRVRYKPAHDVNGRPIASPATRLVQFSLPR